MNKINPIVNFESAPLHICHAIWYWWYRCWSHGGGWSELTVQHHYGIVLGPSSTWDLHCDGTFCVRALLKLSMPIIIIFLFYCKYLFVDQILLVCSEFVILKKCCLFDFVWNRFFFSVSYQWIFFFAKFDWTLYGIVAFVRNISFYCVSNSICVWYWKVLLNCSFQKWNMSIFVKKIKIIIIPFLLF